MNVSADPDTRIRAEGATYLARPARERLAAAQAALDGLPVSIKEGRWRHLPGRVLALAAPAFGTAEHSSRQARARHRRRQAERNLEAQD